MARALVIVEHCQGRLAEINAQVFALARRLCGRDFAGLLLAGRPDDLAQEAAAFCPRLYTLASPALDPYNAAAWLPALESALGRLEPGLILLGQTAFGLDLAPALAQRLGAPLATDVTAADLDGQILRVSRPVFGGKLAADLLLPLAPWAALTLRPGVIEPLQAGPAGEVSPLEPPPPPEKLARRVVGLIRAAAGVDLTRARIIVAVGRGIDGPENIDLARDLADRLGAELACSRPVADLGWLDKERQVGVSGQTVKPRIYLALGISGAFQHQMGMSGSETIIAVNRDPEAPIFDIAHFGLVGDLFEVVPSLIEVLEE